MTEKEELRDRARVIPASVLKAEVQASGTKADLISDMLSTSPERLRALTDYYELKAEKSIFLFRIPKKALIGFKDLESARKSLNAELAKLREKDAPKFEVKRLTRLAKGDEIVAQIRYQKQKHTDHEWEGEVHVHRDTRSATVGLNFDKGYAVVHTRSGKKATACLEQLAHSLFGRPESAELIVLEVEEMDKKFGGAKPKYVVVDGLKLPGTKQITLRGEDVRRTVQVLKAEYELDFHKIGGALRYGGADTQKQVRFGADGRLMFPSRKLDKDQIIEALI